MIVQKWRKGQFGNVQHCGKNRMKMCEGDARDGDEKKVRGLEYCWGGEKKAHLTYKDKKRKNCIGAREGGKMKERGFRKRL